MKRSAPLQRRTPLKPGTKPLRAKNPMAMGQARMRSSRPKSKKRQHKRASENDFGYLEACRGQECYLQVPGVFRHDVETVVPCHSNQQKHGKGMGLKALDVYTVPGCFACHFEIDQGNRLTREEKFSVWDKAYARWAAYRETLLFRDS